MEIKRTTGVPSTDGTAKILVVDAGTAERDLLGRLLTKLGFEVETCRNSHHAMDKLRQGRFDVMVAELTVLSSDSASFLAKVKQLDPSCQVVVVTDCTSEESAVRAVKLGAFHCLSKPLNLRQVRTVVDRAVADVDVR
jgi:DNA-binding NtrC family response regulator